jgi:formate/nitrite transporter
MSRTPAETAQAVAEAGAAKAKLPLGRMFLLGILAGAYIGFGAHLATTVATGTWPSWGLQRLAVGAAFSVGLMLVVVAGAELFTGNNLMTVALCSRQIGLAGLLRNWGIVYAGNLVGSVALALIVAKGSALLAGPVGGTAITIAAAKVNSAPVDGINHNLAFFFRAIGCNWLVCLAVVMAMASKSVGGKILAVFFPIMAFVASGFEHCVANMYFIPAGIFAAGFTSAREACALTPVQLASLNWITMWTHNLIAVTIGNIVGGAVFVGVACFLANLSPVKAPAEEVEERVPVLAPVRPVSLRQRAPALLSSARPRRRSRPHPGSVESPH